MPLCLIDKICCYQNDPIKKIVWQITDKCNLNCNYCYTPKNGLKELPLKEKLALINTFKTSYPNKNKLLIAGREPLMVKHLDKIIVEASKNEFLCSISTNGELINKNNLVPLIDSGLRKVNVTLNSFDYNIQRSHRKKSEASRVLHAIRLCKSFNLFVNVNVNILRNNLYTLENTMYRLLEMRVDELTLSYINASNISYSDFEKDLVKRVIKNLHDSYSNKDAIINYIDNQLILPCYENSLCPVKKGLISLMPNGDIVGCNIYNKTIPYERN